MKHSLENDVYVIEDDNGKPLMTIRLTDEPGNQVIIETDKEVYSGPISLLNLSSI